MKRSYTEESDFTPSPPVESPNNSLSPSPETPKKPKSSPKKAKTSPKGESEQNGSWTGEKRAIFMDRIIEKGYKETDLGALAREVSGLCAIVLKMIHS